MANASRVNPSEPRVNILHRSIFDAGLISGERGGHFINVREGQSLRIAAAGHVLRLSLIPVAPSLCFGVFTASCIKHGGGKSHCWKP